MSIWRINIILHKEWMQPKMGRGLIELPADYQQMYITYCRTAQKMGPDLSSKLNYMHVSMKSPASTALRNRVEYR